MIEHLIRATMTDSKLVPHLNDRTCEVGLLELLDVRPRYARSLAMESL